MDKNLAPEYFQEYCNLFTLFKSDKCYFIVITGMTLKRYIFPLNSVPSYFNGGLSFVAFSIVEGNVNIFCGITKTYTLIISLFSIKKFFEQLQNRLYPR